jgi:hypothetical protein
MFLETLQLLDATLDLNYEVNFAENERKNTLTQTCRLTWSNSYIIFVIIIYK